MPTPPLSPNLTRAVLDFLGVGLEPSSLEYLDTLLTAYTRTVPWESAFRIVRRAHTSKTADCPRWPETFWSDAMERGGGGTCFESNYAFFSLLRALGYEGYLTVNNMRDDGGDYSPDVAVPSIGCHSAIVLYIDGGCWLADVGLPVFAALPIVPAATTTRSSPFFEYTVRPDGEDRYQIERNPHPAPNCFTLINMPVADKPYRTRLTADYGEKGHFLNEVIVNKVVDGCLWRFCSSEQPLHLEEFIHGKRVDHVLNGDIAVQIAAHFGMDEETVRAALMLAEKLNI